MTVPAAATSGTDQIPEAEAQATSKRATIDRVQESALKMFSRHGFEGASLRDIAADAGVPLSTIDRYFGTKLDLMKELESQIWRDVNRDRDLLMKRPIEVDAHGDPTLQAVLYAFVHPVVARGAEDTATLRLLREYAAMHVHAGLGSPFNTVAERWVKAIMVACPKLSRVRAVWMLAFVVSVTFSDQFQHGWYNELLPEGGRLSSEDLTRMIVTFCTSGVTAVAEFT